MARINITRCPKISPGFRPGNRQGQHENIETGNQ